MPRNISFALTTPQFLDGTKDVTRRLGWLFLRAGDELMAVEKSQGLGKGGKIKRLGMIRIVSVRREPLSRLMTAAIKYGYRECVREGFPPPHDLSWPKNFVDFFMASHRGCGFHTIITRIEFVRLETAHVDIPKQARSLRSNAGGSATCAR